jgi:predicted PolB exonuclease-like 3'-5' exonuclease
MSMVNTKRRFSEVPHLSTIRKLAQLSISLVQSKALFSKQTKESKLSLQDSVLSKVVSIMVQSIQFGEIQDTLNISSQSEIGLQRFGAKISDPQLCRLGITLPTLLMDAGPQQDVVYSSSLELMVSSMSGISTIDKMRSHTVKRSVILHLHLL